jgi:hemerythrin superfamily protein
LPLNRKPVGSLRKLDVRRTKMPTNAKTKAKTAAARKIKTKTQSGRSEGINAVELLKHDHREVEAYFDEYEDLEDNAEKDELAAKICEALKAHMQIEEEIFYPAARAATGDDDLLDEAVVEHAGAKHLIEEIESMEIGDDLYDAKIRVLGEQIKHHVKEEEEELFPEVERSDIDLKAVGKELEGRKMELMAGTAAARR